MLRLWNKLFLALCVIAVVSCDFVDLRQIGINTEPGMADFVLPEPHSPVIVRFDTQMIKNEAEAILHVSSDLGTKPGDKFWEGNNLYFVPTAGWTAGVRYTLGLRGTVRAVDGREKRVEHFVSFFAINRNALPLLDSFKPANSASVGTNDLVLEFHFSCSMDRLSVESAFSLDGVTNRTFEWEDDDKILKVIPESILSPWTLYRWTLRDSARSINGVQLPKTYSGYFTTDLDQKHPQVTSIFPVLFSNGNWYPTGAPVETGLGVGQAIVVEFSKPMGESALRSLRFEPSLAGRTEFLSEESIVYIFTRDLEPETTYTLTVSGDTRDTEGLRIGEDFRLNFTVDIPFLNVLSFTADGNVIDIESMTNNIIPVRVEPGTGEVNFSLRFSLIFDFEEKLKTPQRISLAPFFPRTLTPVALQFISWISDDRLFMRWEGLTPSDGESHYYRLTIPGGRGGISSSTGIFMKEDFILYLEVIR
jgi:hypothetical protein